MQYTVFDHNIYIKEFDDLGKFEHYRNFFITQLSNCNYSEQRGDNIFPIRSINDLQTIIGHGFLKKEINHAIIEAGAFIYKNVKVKNFLLTQTWYNINYKNSSGVSHMHSNMDNPIKKLICILYLEAPENSGKLAIINDNRAGLSCTDFDQNKVHYITVRPNMFICHSNHVNHAISKHLSDDRRLSIVFDYILEEE